VAYLIYSNKNLFFPLLIVFRNVLTGMKNLREIRPSFHEKQTVSVWGLILVADIARERALLVVFEGGVAFLVPPVEIEAHVGEKFV